MGSLRLRLRPPLTSNARQPEGMSTLRWIDPRLVPALVISTTAFSVAYLEWSFGVGAAALLGLTQISFTAFGIGALLWGFLGRRRTMLIAGVYSLALVVLTTLVVRVEGTHRKAESFRRGDAIVTALSSFRAEHNRYPDSLRELVPKYLTEIPHSSMSALYEIPFTYRLKGTRGFGLAFPAPAWLICQRTESTPWACND